MTLKSVFGGGDMSISNFPPQLNLLGWYKLNPDKTVSPVTHIREITKTPDRMIKKTKVGKKLVSTVFLGIDHRFNNESEPILFETMVFPNPEENLLDELCERYSTYNQAVAGHDRIVQDLKKQLEPTINTESKKLRFRG